MNIKKRGLYLLILLLVLNLASAFIHETGESGYSSPWWDLGDFKFSFWEFYQNYGYIIDSVVFLFVFIGLGKATIGDRFEGAGKSFFVAIGIFLAVALMIWEEKTKFYLLLEFGPVALILFIVIVLVMIFEFFQGMGAAGIYAAAGTYIAFFFFLGYFIENPNFQWVKDFVSVWAPAKLIYAILFILLVIALIVLALGLIGIFVGRRTMGRWMP